MSDEVKVSVHTLPLDTLRVRVKEADRLVEQARAIVRQSFTREKAPESGGGHQVGGVLDAIERLLPGIGLLAVQLTDRSSPQTIPVRRAERSERSEIVRGLAERVASLLTEIERGRSVAPPRTSPSVAPPRMLSPYPPPRR